MRALRPQKITSVTAGINNRQIRADGLAALLGLRERIEARLNTASATDNMVPQNKLGTGRSQKQ